MSNKIILRQGMQMKASFLAFTYVLFMHFIFMWVNPLAHINVYTACDKEYAMATRVPNPISLYCT